MVDIETPKSKNSPVTDLDNIIFLRTAEKLIKG